MKLLLGKLGVVLLVFFIFYPCKSFGQQDSIWFAGMEIKIGMAKTHVLSEIAKNYIITKEKDMEGSWTVKSKEGIKYGHIGLISFEKDKVHWVGKSWGDYGKNEAIEFAKTIYNVLLKFSNEGKRVLLLDLASIKEPKTSLDEVILIAGKRKLILMIHENGISVQENLEK
jgi:hypothetical protein